MEIARHRAEPQLEFVGNRLQRRSAEAGWIWNSILMSVTPPEMALAIATSLIASIIYATVGGGYRRWFGQQIKIIEPQENGFLAPAEPRRGVQAHPVAGTLKYLPENHRIWLIVVDETKGKFWSQGFEPVEYHKDTGTWKGYVHVWGWHHVTLIAVVAPPTSQEYFNYFQRVGQKTGYEPLLGIPLEGKKRATVRAKVPPTPPMPVP